MASTSGFNPEPQSENKHTNASERIGPSPSTSATSLVGSLFSCCFDWCSHMCSMISVPYNSVFSMSTTNTQPENEVVSAFDEIQPFSSTYGTSSVSKRNLPFDVFINHHGPDVKHTLATTLYKTLTGMGLRVFLDKEELEFGDSLPVEIEQAIRSASLHIAIFSKNYAQSPWCLEELSFMLKTGTIIVPVFYHVQPDDVRYAKGLYSEAFSKRRKKGKYTPEKLQEWKNTLNNVSYYVGEIVHKKEDETRMLKNIVTRVLQVIRNVPFTVAKHPVGLDEIVRDFEMTTLHSTDSHHHAQIVGICGMGGSGKTTLAKQLYNNRFKSMENGSFLSDIRDAFVHDRLFSKQKELLDDLGLRNVSIDNIEEGKMIIASRLRSLRVFIVLDDVDNVDQLDALIPQKDSLGLGSLIVVTTRESGVLRSWGISTIYNMKGLSDMHAKQLFCWHAFLQPSPPSEFEDLVEKFLRTCQGLPLSLKVLGALLYGKNNKLYWVMQLEKISRILPEDIRGRLKVSYDALYDEEKEVFLDISCFLVGEKKSLAIAIWDGCDWHGLRSLESLMDKGLVELDQQSCIRMQGQLRELGREIANNHLPCRLWSSEQIHRLYQNAQETLQIHGIMAATTQFSSCSAHHEFPSYSSSYQPPLKECLKIMKSSISQSFPSRHFSVGLKLLVTTGDDFNSKFAKLSEDLVWLRWFDFKHTTLPSWESLRNLRILELYGATTLKELWEDAKPPPFRQLIELNITCSWGSGLKRFPRSISDLKHLKKIALIGYLGDEFPIKRLPEEFCDLDKLEHLELRHCRVLSSLPSRFGELTKLRHLDLSSCVELRMLPVSFNQLTCLKYLDLSGCRKLTFRLDFLKSISKLEKLDFTGCRRLQELPHEIASQAYLRQLSMRDTRLRNMPSNMDQLRKLSTLQIGSPFLRSLPPSLGLLSSLSHLTIFDCPNLESLPDSVGWLCRLQYLCIESSGVKCLPESFRQLACLEAFEISGCPIRELDFGKEFSSSSCLGSLKLLRIVDTQLSRVSISDDCCPVLKTLQLMQNEVLAEIVNLPTSLEEIKLWECERLEDISCIQNLPNLKYIDK